MLSQGNDDASDVCKWNETFSSKCHTARKLSANQISFPIFIWQNEQKRGEEMEIQKEEKVKLISQLKQKNTSQIIIPIYRCTAKFHVPIIIKSI